MALIRLIAALLLLCLSVSPASAAEGSALVRLDPASQAVAQGATATITVRLEDARDVYGLDVRLRFDPAVIEIVDADPSKEGVQVIQGTFPYPDFVVRNAVENVTGTIHYALVQLNPRPPATGAGVVFSVQARGKIAGRQTNLSVEFVEMADRNGQALPARMQGGALQVTAASQGAAATATPTTAATATMVAAPAPTATMVVLPTSTVPIAPTSTRPASAGPATATATAVVQLPAVGTPTTAGTQPAAATVSPAAASPASSPTFIVEPKTPPPIPTASQAPVSMAAPASPTPMSASAGGAASGAGQSVEPAATSVVAAAAALPGATATAARAASAPAPLSPAPSGESGRTSLTDRLLDALGLALIIGGAALLVALLVVTVRPWRRRS